MSISYETTYRTVANLAVIYRVNSGAVEFKTIIEQLKLEANKNQTCVFYDVIWVDEDYVHILEKFNIAEDDTLYLSDKHKTLVNHLKENDRLLLTGMDHPSVDI